MRISRLQQFLGQLGTMGIPGYGRLTKFLTGKFLILKKTKYQTLLWLDPRQRIDREIIETGSFDDEVITAIGSRLQQGDVFWDVGANIGHHALAIKKQYEDVQVIAFEPHPLNLARLHKNMEQNQLEFVTQACALSDREGVTTLYTTPANSGRTGIKYMRNSHTFGDVDTMRAETLINEGLPMPTIMKVDVEGGELEVLSGFGDYLNDPQLRCVVFEVINENENPFKLLEQSGFRVRALDQRGNFIAER